jgi:hypothetical protein
LTSSVTDAKLGLSDGKQSDDIVKNSFIIRTFDTINLYRVFVNTSDVHQGVTAEVNSSRNLLIQQQEFHSPVFFGSACQFFLWTSQKEIKRGLGQELSAAKLLDNDYQSNDILNSV